VETWHTRFISVGAEAKDDEVRKVAQDYAERQSAVHPEHAKASDTLREEGAIDAVQVPRGATEALQQRLPHENPALFGGQRRRGEEEDVEEEVVWQVLEACHGEVGRLRLAATRSRGIHDENLLELRDQSCDDCPPRLLHPTSAESSTAPFVAALRAHTLLITRSTSARCNTTASLAGSDPVGVDRPAKLCFSAQSTRIEEGLRKEGVRRCGCNVGLGVAQLLVNELEGGAIEVGVRVGDADRSERSTGALEIAAELDDLMHVDVNQPATVDCDAGEGGQLFHRKTTEEVEAFCLAADVQGAQTREAYFDGVSGAAQLVRGGESELSKGVVKQMGEAEEGTGVLINDADQLDEGWTLPL
ncbi:hypothetical protein RTBOTA2_003270, partial [Rhodotorula toruloides]